MKYYSATTALLNTVSAIYGYNLCAIKSINADILTKTIDRYGCRIIVKLVSGELIDGRFSNGHKFNGTVTLNGVTKKYKSFHKGESK